MVEKTYGKSKAIPLQTKVCGSILALKQGKIPDCIIIKIPDYSKEPVIMKEAKQTLKQIIEKQKCK